jgi:hypothetical protein
LDGSEQVSGGCRRRPEPGWPLIGAASVSLPCDTVIGPYGICDWCLLCALYGVVWRALVTEG